MLPRDDAICMKSTSALRAMATAVGGEIGLSFLRRVVETLRDAMSVDLVLISVGDGIPATRARAVYALSDGSPLEMDYALTGTPCQIVYGGDRLVIPCDLARQFPREEGLDSYASVPIRNAEECVCGHFALFSKKPIKDVDAVEDILRIFAARVEADRRHEDLLTERNALIEDLIRLNDSMRRRSQALHDANHFKTQLMGMIAHDMRSPLAALVARTELLESRLMRDHFDRAVAQTDLTKVLACADRLSNMITTTLEKCRAESNAININPTPIRLSDLILVSMETNKTAAELKSIRIETNVPDDATAHVDEVLCLDAIDNLISNSIKYSPRNTRVSISVDTDPEWVRIKVKDEGQGLSESDIRLAFRPFQTLSAKPTGDESATGLGLASVRSFAEAHGGTVFVESDGVGKGAVFTIQLPRG